MMQTRRDTRKASRFLLAIIPHSSTLFICVIYNAEAACLHGPHYIKDYTTMHDAEKLERRKTAGPSLPEKLKERLYPAVLELFSDNDFHRVNMREIYSRSGISPSTIYRYFSSKEELLFTILDEKISEIAELVRIHIQGIESTREILRKIFWVTLDYYDRNPGVAITAFITTPLRTWMREKSYVQKDTMDILSRIYSAAIERGDIDPEIRVSDCLDQYYMHCYRQIHLWYYHGMKWKLVETLPRFFPILWKTISPPVTKP